MSSHPALRLAYYADDFTGSTDAMEALALAGMRTVLFLRPPDRAALARFPGLQAVGVAGLARAMLPAWMDRELPAAFAAIKALGAPIAHYKVCSTFDSSPEKGSIGRALEVGQRAFGSPFVPIVVGLPRLGRYCAFGNLFARSGHASPVYRLDRHPTMRHHPSTPMDESDLRLHLGRQTCRSVALFDASDLEVEPDAREMRFAALLAERPDAVLFDVMRDAHLARIGSLLAAHASPEAPLFAIGSSAIEYAFAAYWQERGDLAGGPSFAPDGVGGSVDRLVVVSGSCSPVTARQVAFARERGFVEVALHPERLSESAEGQDETRRVTEAALDALARGRSIVVHTCLGPDDPRREATNALFGRTDSAALLGGALGAILRRVLTETTLHRAVVVGGDTSGHVVRRLGLDALEMVAPSTPGAPLCRGYADDALDGLQLVLKGGQVGPDSYFVDVLRVAETPRMPINEEEHVS